MHKPGYIHLPYKVFYSNNCIFAEYCAFQIYANKNWEKYSKQRFYYVAQSLQHNNRKNKEANHLKNNEYLVLDSSSSCSIKSMK